MSFDKCKDVWVFIECFQGEPKSVGFKVGAVIHPIAMSYEEKELIRSMNTTESKVYFAPTFFYKTDYEQRILAVMDQIPSLKGVVMLDYARERKSNLPSLAEIIVRKGLVYGDHRSGSMDVNIEDGQLEPVQSVYLRDGPEKNLICAR